MTCDITLKSDSIGYLGSENWTRFQDVYIQSQTGERFGFNRCMLASVRSGHWNATYFTCFFGERFIFYDLIGDNFPFWSFQQIITLSEGLLIGQRYPPSSEQVRDIGFKNTVKKQTEDSFLMTKPGLHQPAVQRAFPASLWVPPGKPRRNHLHFIRLHFVWAWNLEEPASLGCPAWK